MLMGMFKEHAHGQRMKRTSICSGSSMIHHEKGCASLWGLVVNACAGRAHRYGTQGRIPFSRGCTRWHIFTSTGFCKKAALPPNPSQTLIKNTSSVPMGQNGQSQLEFEHPLHNSMQDFRAGICRTHMVQAPIQEPRTIQNSKRGAADV